MRKGGRCVKVRAEVLPLVTLVPGWWDVQSHPPGASPAPPWALYATVEPDDAAGLHPATAEARLESAAPAPGAIPTPAGLESPEPATPAPASVQAALAAAAARALADRPPPGPLELAARVAAALAAQRRAPAPWTDAAAAALGGAVCLVPGADGRPSPGPAPDGALEAAVRDVLERRLLLWRPPQPARPGWARRRAVLAWLATGATAAPAVAASTASSTDTCTEESLASDLERVWRHLEPLHREEPVAARELERARAAGAVAAIVVDDGDLVAALFPPHAREEAAARLASTGVRATRPHLALRGLTVRVEVPPPGAR